LFVIHFTEVDLKKVEKCSILCKDAQYPLAVNRSHQFVLLRCL